MKVGFVGLGQMGKHMALNLASARHQLIVSDIRTDAFPEFQERGVEVTTDVRDVAAADIIFLSLPNGDVLKSALFGPSGMADGSVRFRAKVRQNHNDWYLMDVEEPLHLVSWRET